MGCIGLLSRIGLVIMLALVLFIGLAVWVGGLMDADVLVYSTIRGEIYTYDMGRSLTFNLTRDIGRSSQPVWMPDGEHILFRLLDRVASPLYIMEASGRNKQPYGDPSRYVVDPAPSPDGQWLAFSSLSDNEITLDIFLLNLEDNSLTRLTNSNSYDVEPTWSPDSQTIAFASDRNDFYEIYAMDRTGDNLRLLKDFSHNDQPAWAPDGTAIAFVSSRNNISNVYLMDDDGGNMVLLTENDTSDTFPAWSPDSSQLVYVSNVAGVSSIYVMNRDGSEKHLLIPNATTPRWRPD